MSIFTLDVLERVLWTATQAAAGAALDVLVSGDVTWRAVGYAIAIAVLKTIVVAPLVGDRNSAATLPSPPDHAPGA